MQCPSCGRPPIRLFRFSFSKRGVNYIQSFKGYLRCRHCGELLRIVGFKPIFWIYFGVLFAFFCVFMIFLKRIISNVGYEAPLNILVVWLLLILFGSTYILRKTARLEKSS